MTKRGRAVTEARVLAAAKAAGLGRPRMMDGNLGFYMDDLDRLVVMVKIVGIGTKASRRHAALAALRELGKESPK